MRIKKRIISFILTIVLLISMSANVLAISLIPSASPSLPSDEGKTMVESVLGIIEVSAYAVAFGMLFYVGIKYTMAAANEKADLKASSVKYIVGAILIFGAGVLTKIILNMMKDEIGDELPGM